MPYAGCVGPTEPTEPWQGGRKRKQKIRFVVAQKISESELIGKLQAAPLWAPSISCSTDPWAQLGIRPKELLKFMACKFFKQSNPCPWEERSWSVSFPPADGFVEVNTAIILLERMQNIRSRFKKKKKDKMKAMKYQMSFNPCAQDRIWLFTKFYSPTFALLSLTCIQIWINLNDSIWYAHFYLEMDWKLVEAWK